MRLRKNDMVMVITGKSKGKIGKILTVLADQQRALVEKLNMVKRHQRPTAQNKQGGIVEKEAPIHVSNLMLIDPKDKKPTRVSYKVMKDGTKMRVSRRTGEVIK